jgi:hypothetical protein
MRKLLFAAAAAAALALIPAAPGQARASWLSQALHAYFDRGYYAPYYPYAAPYGYDYDGPAYDYGYAYGPAYDGLPWYGYSVPYYAPYRTYGYYYRPSYGRSHAWHEWHEHHGWRGPEWHGGSHGHHHR